MTDREMTAEQAAESWFRGNVRAERGMLIRQGMDRDQADRQARENVAQEAARVAGRLRAIRAGQDRR